MPAAVNGTARSANGLWGSIWMLPASTSVEDNTYELDIMESGYKLNTVDPLRVVTTNLHRPTASQIYYDSGVDLSAGFHTYAVEYDTSNGNVAFYLDGVYRGGYTGIGPRDEMFLLINTHVANAGFPGISGWHTLPSTGTAASMDVAGVRVFEK
jgi:beta-glucanase (GH16 family)